MFLCLLDTNVVERNRLSLCLNFNNFLKLWFEILVRGHCEEAFRLFPCCLLLGDIHQAAIRVFSKYREQIWGPDFWKENKYCCNICWCQLIPSSAIMTANMATTAPELQQSLIPVIFTCPCTAQLRSQSFHSTLQCIILAQMFMS